MYRVLLELGAEKDIRQLSAKAHDRVIAEIQRWRRIHDHQIAES